MPSKPTNVCGPALGLHLHCAVPGDPCTHNRVCPYVVDFAAMRGVPPATPLKGAGTAVAEEASIL